MLRKPFPCVLAGNNPEDPTSCWGRKPGITGVEIVAEKE